MKLLELTMICSDTLQKYGDREVLVDVEARTFHSHMVNITYAGMSQTDEEYENHPMWVFDPLLGCFYIGGLQ